MQAPETPDEEQFVQQYGALILRINKNLIRYTSTRQLSLVNDAYHDLIKLYGELDARLKQWSIPGTKLHLASTAPRLLTLRDCLLVVPGQYDAAIKLDDQAFFDSFHPTADVLSSKQLPRKLVIRSYEKDFTFLLKGEPDHINNSQSIACGSTDSQGMKTFGAMNVSCSCSGSSTRY